MNSPKDPFCAAGIDKKRQKRLNEFSSKLYYFLVDSVENGDVDVHECLDVLKTMTDHLEEQSTPLLNIEPRNVD